MITHKSFTTSFVVYTSLFPLYVSKKHKAFSYMIHTYHTVVAAYKHHRTIITLLFLIYNLYSFSIILIIFLLLEKLRHFPPTLGN